MLTLGWSDGFSFAPLDFVMLSSAKLANRLYEMASNLSNRSNGYKRRMEAFSWKPDAVVAFLDRALREGFTTDYVLMDSWFTQVSLLRELTAKGLPVNGMDKEMKQRFLVQDKRMTLREMFQSLPQSNAKDIKGSVIVQTTCGLPVKFVFVRNRNKKGVAGDFKYRRNPRCCCNRTNLRYAWSIETFFKVTKSYLKLGTEFQGRSFDQLISITTIVFTRYLAMNTNGVNRVMI